MNARIKFSDHLKLIKNIKTTGTITPSSRALINQLLAQIDFKQARSIVELGPGNGCVTRALLQRMHEDCVLICLEVNNDFVAQLNSYGDTRLRVYNACASSIRQILDTLSIDTVDHIVSSLPLALMDDDVVAAVVVSAEANLAQGGRFLQYQYSLRNYADLKPVFERVKLRFTLRNMPPAFIYECFK
jgi:phospholipid N-methyltransferase